MSKYPAEVVAKVVKKEKTERECQKDLYHMFKQLDWAMKGHKGISYDQ